MTNASRVFLIFITMWLLGFFVWPMLSVLAMAGLVLQGFFSAAHRAQNARRIFSLPENWLSLSMFALMAAGYFWSENKEVAQTEITQKSIFLFAPLALGLSMHHVRAFKKNILGAFVLLMVISSIYCFLAAAWRTIASGQWHREYSSGTFRDWNFTYTGLSDPFGHPGNFGLLVGVAALVCFYTRFFSDESKKRKRAALWTGLYLFAFLFLLMSKNTLLAFFIVLLVGGVAWGAKNKKLYPALIVVLSPVVFLVLFSWLAPEKISERFTSLLNLEYDITAPEMSDFNTVTVRLAEWSCARDAIADSPWIGHGPGDAKHTLIETYTKRGFVVGANFNYNAHNQFLDTWLKIGVAGPLIYLTLLFMGLLRAKQGHLLYGFFVLFATLCLVADSILERQIGLNFYLFFTFFFLFSLSGNEEEAGEHQA